MPTKPARTGDNAAAFGSDVQKLRCAAQPGAKKADPTGDAGFAFGEQIVLLADALGGVYQCPVDGGGVFHVAVYFARRKA